MMKKETQQSIGYWKKWQDASPGKSVRDRVVKIYKNNTQKKRKGTRER